MGSKDDGAVIQSVADECERAIADDDVGALILGCGGFYGILDGVRKEIKKRGYDVPLVESHKTAIEVVRTLLKFGYKQSRITYPQLGDYEGL